MGISDDEPAATPEARRRSVPGAAFQPGAVLAGHFEIVRKIGAGGMGVVYEAIDRISGERIALKCIKSEHSAHGQVNARFIEEINTARKLRHPNIVAVYDVAQQDEQLFFTMEYLDGMSLRGRLNQLGRLPLNEVVQVMRPLCNALEYAHRHMVHRDLSPDNVFLLRDRGVKLLDFGLARDISRETMTMSGARLGKAQYISPEQRKDAAHVDARADVYALGVMFFELLSGQLPLGYARLSDHLPDLPPACDQLVAQALAPLELRIRSAAEFRSALDACIQSQSGVPSPAPSPDRDTALSELTPEVESPQPVPPRGRTGLSALRVRTLVLTGVGLVIVVAGLWASLSFLLAPSEPALQTSPPPVVASTNPSTMNQEPSQNPLLPVSQGWPHIEEARALMEAYTRLSYPPPPQPLEIKWENRAQEALLHLPGGVTLAMVWIPPGSFISGSEMNLGTDFLPVHPVKLTRGFWMGKYELTQAQWKAVMTANPSRLIGDTLPVDGVSWDDAMLFIKRLNRASEVDFRLPTEAEWVYAAQAGIDTPGQLLPDGAAVNDYVWNAKNSRGRVHAVGEKFPNAWGLFDMSGNVWEWCSNYYSPNYMPRELEIDPLGPESGAERMCMGGCTYRDDPNPYCNVARRNRFPPGMRAEGYGFRLCAD